MDCAWEIAGVLALMGLGAAAGYGCGRLGRFWWVLGYVLPLVLVLLTTASLRFRELSFLVPFSWLTAGRNEFGVLAVAPVMVMAALAYRLKGTRIKVLVLIFAFIFSGYDGVYPIVEPLVTRAELERIQTKLDSRGVCIQSTDYTCGPAAAVTALHVLGIRGDEGKIALAAYTGFDSGTAPDSLCLALNQLHGQQGRRWEYRLFRSFDELKSRCPAIVVIEYSLFLDHYVTVLDVRGDQVVVGDPLAGKVAVPATEFVKKWRYCGIVPVRVSHSK